MIVVLIISKVIIHQGTDLTKNIRWKPHLINNLDDCGMKMKKS